MLVKIISVNDKRPPGVEVTFSTRYGMGKGVWMNEPPSVGHEYHIELDIDEKVALLNVITQKSSRDFAIRQENSGLILQGEIEAVEFDNICTLRLGDSILLIEVTGPVPSPGTFVRFAIQDLLLFDT